MRFIPVLILLFRISSTLAQDSDRLIRQPDISKDGERVTFSYQGDIWTVSAEGGTANRLTIHEAYESMPVFNAKATAVAFHGERYGNRDIFVIPATGGVAERITHHSTSDVLSDYTDSDLLLFTTNRNYAQVERDDEIYAAAPMPGTPTRVVNALGYMPVASPNGRYMAFVKGNCRTAREDYKGPANKDLWLFDSEDESYTQLTSYEGNDFMPRWVNDETLYFISSRSGRYNVWRLNLNQDSGANEPEQVTAFEGEGIRHFSVSESGKLVIERGMGLLTMQPGQEPQPLNIQLSGDYRFDPNEYKTYTSQANNYQVSPNGKLIALEIRGEIFITQNDKEKKRSVNVTQHPFRDSEPQWLNDSTLVFISDRNGQPDIYLLQSSDPDRPSLFRTLKTRITPLTDTQAFENDIYLSPSKQKIAFMRNRGTLVVADIDQEGLSNETILLDGWDSPDGISWSPDSKWLAYGLSDLTFNQEIFIHKADNSIEPVNVSMHPKTDASPVWSQDGSKLGFLSLRNNGDYDVWFAWLKEADYEKTQRDWEESEPENKSDKDKKDSDAPDVVIDLENIHERLQQVTSLPGNESNLAIGPKGEAFYFSTNRDGRQDFDADQDLMKVKWDGSDMEAITRGNTRPYGVRLAENGEELFFLSRGGRLNSVKPGTTSTTSLPYRASMTIQYPEEYKQVFDEAWATLNKGFYDPDFHGYDWEGLREKYRPMALAASTPEDFQYMFNIMLGQLNASHMGLYRVDDRADTQDAKTGLLGVEIDSQADGLRVARVVPESPADRTESQLNVGEVITSINGTPVSTTENFYQPLLNTANEEVLLTVRNGNDTREVIIRPTSSLRRELYNEWVDERKALTDKYSDGKLGYVHIQGMNWTSFERFERELMASGYGREGIVIDVRYNGGGWTTDYLMAVLNVDQHAYTVPRGSAEDLDEEHKQFREYYPFGERLPLASWMKPSIALCNTTSYSNAEIFSHAYKNLDIGTLVGEPTFGAVISTGGKTMMNGAYVRLPFRGWYVKATDKNMEHGPAVPDIILSNSPDSKARGVDEQLQRAVKELLNEIEEDRVGNGQSR